MMSFKGSYEAIVVNDATQNYLQAEYFMLHFPSVIRPHKGQKTVL